MSAQDQSNVAATDHSNILPADNAMANTDSTFLYDNTVANDSTVATNNIMANNDNTLAPDNAMANNDTTLVYDNAGVNDSTLAADNVMDNDSTLAADNVMGNDSTLAADNAMDSSTSDVFEEGARLPVPSDSLSHSFTGTPVSGAGPAVVVRRSSSGSEDWKDVHFSDLSRFNKYRRSFTDINESRKEEEKERSEGGERSDFQRFSFQRKTLMPKRAKDVEFGDLSRFAKYRRPKSTSNLDKNKGGEGEFNKVFNKSSSTLTIGETINEDPSGGEDTASQADPSALRGIPSNDHAGAPLPRRSSHLGSSSYEGQSPARPKRHSNSLDEEAAEGLHSLAGESPARLNPAQEDRAPPSDMVGEGARRKSRSASGHSADQQESRAPYSHLQQPPPVSDSPGSGLRKALADGGSGGRLGGRSSASRTPAPSTVPPPPPLPHYSRRSSEESNNEEPASKDVRELEEKFRVAMINNASLDNDKTRLTFQIEELKDCRTDLTEQLTQLKKEHKKKCSEHEQLRKVYAKLQEESRAVRRVLEERDELIQEFGLVVVGRGDEEEEEGDEEEDEALAAREETEDGLVLPRPVPMKRVLLTQEAAEILQQGAAKGSLEWRLRRVVERKRELEDELRRVNLELAEQVNTQRQSNCIDSNIQKEANKTVNEYKFRVQKAEAEVSSLQANVNRLEALVTRYKAQTEELERSEEELKAEKRRLQRELREATNRLDELETANSHLVRRFELLRNARSNLLREMSQDPI